ncbi:uncharacterized protein LOC126455608 [Schistocerca serialis cubense]|uniref:uncharacterized protein LOC126455608 n=1 Tax=Schistocerca serialis cubense TaxID=2023355 RepID=UPI00214E4002|nr:uncharacterized protein LOC126455608 [Schistocerca serialis cubense]
MGPASSLALLAAFAVTWGAALAADCSVGVDTASMPSPQPVLLSSGNAQDFSSFLLPNGTGSLTVGQGLQVIVACPGSSFLLLDNAGDHVTAECLTDTRFSVNSVEYTLNALACAEAITPTARYTSTSCGAFGHFSIVEVGFAVGTEFYRLYDVCFSNKTLTTFYTHHTIPSTIAGAQVTDLSSANWTDSGFYGDVDIGAAYSEQNLTIGDLLNTTVDDYFAEGRLERGALAPATDFMLEAHQVATFFGVNSAPRWTQLDEGNWATLEDSLRNVTATQNRDLEVYTGALGVLTLNNSDGVSTALYLSGASGSKKTLPVPRYFWKMAYDPQSRLCAVFITVNNPFANQQELETRYRLCTDICDKVNWLTWDQSNQTAGLSYCCSYDDFRRVVPGVPELDVKGYAVISSGASALAMSLTATLIATVTLVSSFGGV